MFYSYVSALIFLNAPKKLYYYILYKVFLDKENNCRNNICLRD